MAAKKDAQGASTLLLDQYFEAGDERFLSELFSCTVETKFKPLSKKWFFDRRPFAREMLRRYIADGCDRPHQRLLVKRLFKFAEENEDHDLMSCFVVALDRMSKRALVEVEVYDYGRRKNIKRKFLKRAMSGIPEGFATRKEAKTAPRFSIRTRLYLQRRAFRYLRRLSRKDAAAYGEIVRALLLSYRDEHLQKAEQLLDSWSLLHILYWGSPVLTRQPRGVCVRDGRALGELGPAPFCPRAWVGQFPAIMQLLLEAGARPVRSFAAQLLRRDYHRELSEIPIVQLKRMLLGSNLEAQELGGSLLESSPHLAQLTLDDWIALLRIEQAAVLPVVCAQVVRYVRPEALTLAQCVALAQLKAAPVAELGLRWAMEKRTSTEDDLKTLLRLANAEVKGVREEAVGHLVQELLASEHFREEHLRDLIDSRFADVREQALSLMKGDPRLRESLVLWVALAETPYDDVRAYLIQNLESMQTIFAPETLRGVWAASILAIHRGGRAKRRVVTQIAERIVASPGEAPELLPLLGVALRSVRATERRAALAALTRAALQAPALRSLLGERLPELRIIEEAA